MKVALYIHIPFCARRCTYCDFNTYAGLMHLRTAYFEALKQEILLRAERYGPLDVTSIYFGGGTPSLLAPDEISGILGAIQRHFTLVRDIEITLEANPGTVNEDSLSRLRHVGVNRLSLGVQSANEAELSMLGRIHSWEDAVVAVESARRVGFDSLNLDLIYGLPGQALDDWSRSLEAVLALEPDHLSLYALKLELGTPLAESVAMDALPAPDPDLAADMYELASERLCPEGFWQYEISNWARGRSIPPEVWALPPGGHTTGIGRWVSRHNLTYWCNEPWLGLGAGAYSWFRKNRFSNSPHPRRYIQILGGGRLTPWEVERISPKLEQGETMMMGLRLAEGVTDQRFRTRFSVGLAEVFHETLCRLSDLGLLMWDGTRARLTTRGRLLGNQVFGEFLP